MDSFHRLLLELSHQVDEGRMTEVTAAGLAARHIQAVLRCTRVSFWLVVGEPGARAMQRVVAYDAPADRVITAPVELEEGVSDYFDTLIGKRFYVSDDTFEDPCLAKLVEDFLAPRSVRALMSAYIGVNGDPWGAITCVQDTPRAWTPSEQGLLKRYAADVSVRRARRQAREGASSPIGRRPRTGSALK